MNRVSAPIGGGGSGGSGSGGGSGGVATEEYYDVLTFYDVTIEVGGPGQQSSVAFIDSSSGYRSPSPGRDSNQASGGADTGQYPIRITQDPIFPTVASPGTNGGTTDDSAGAQGAIATGNPTRGTHANSAQGGGGWAGSGPVGVGAGAGGGTGGKQGAARCVWIVAELLA